jgi:flagellar FliL protein
VSDKPEGEGAEAPPKSKKMLVMIIAAVVVLALAGGGGWFFLNKGSGDEEDEEVQQVEKKGPPQYMSLESMTANLADPGGEKMIQVVVTLELSDVKAPDKVKDYVPAIRADALMLLTQSTSEELLTKEGKERLADDIFAEASRHFVDEDPREARKEEAASKDKKKKKKKKKKVDNPIVGVFFSSFIIQ